MKTKPSDPISPLSKDVVYLSEGLSKREHYAGLALRSLLGSTNGLAVPIDPVCRLAVDIADLLIKFLNEKEVK